VPVPGPPPPLDVAPRYSLGQTRGYEAHDDAEHDFQDTGDIPLLRRDEGARFGRAASLLAPMPVPMPGAYEDNESSTNLMQYQQGEEDEGDNQGAHIRYGRIPQRVPRRYKTLKRVE
jgi:hypothetical protein